MIQEQFSHRAHQGMIYHNPLNPQKIRSIIKRLPLKGPAKILDVGSGPGQLLCDIAKQFPDANLVGIDPSQLSTKLAAGRISESGFTGRINLINEKIQDCPQELESLDCAIAMGATHAIGNFAETLKQFMKWVKPGGLALIGEGFWMQDPPQAYLDFLGCKADSYRSFAGNVEFARELGWIELYSGVTNQDEWDEYEGGYLFNIEQYIHEHPDDEDADAYLTKIRRWHKGYLDWGRDSLGFAIHLFRKEARAL